MNGNIHIHQKIIKGNFFESIPDCLITIWFGVNYIDDYDAYDFRIDRIKIHKIIDDELVLIFKQTTTEKYDISPPMVHLAFEILWEDDIVAEFIEADIS